MEVGAEIVHDDSATASSDGRHEDAREEERESWTRCRLIDCKDDCVSFAFTRGRRKKKKKQEAIYIFHTNPITNPIVSARRPLCSTTSRGMAFTSVGVAKNNRALMSLIDIREFGSVDAKNARRRLHAGRREGSSRTDDSGSHLAWKRGCVKLCV